MQKVFISKFWKAFPQELPRIGGCGQRIKLRPQLPQSLSLQPSLFPRTIASPSASPALVPTPPQPAPLSPRLQESYSPAVRQDLDGLEERAIGDLTKSSPKAVGSESQSEQQKRGQGSLGRGQRGAWAEGEPEERGGEGFPSACVCLLCFSRCESGIRC